MTMLCALKESMALESFVEEVIRATCLEEQYQKEDTEEAKSRIENIQEFRGSVHEFAQLGEDSTLEAYLENVALVTDLDRAAENDGYITLMTIHSAKGLEFDNVFIPGMEEGIFPSSRSIEEENRLEEERRLMYVGITRARKRLFLSRASERMLYNQYSHNPPSRFLEEIPARLVKAEYEVTAGHGYKNNAIQRPLRPETNFKSDNGRYNGISASELGKPKLRIKGNDLNNIPGVSKGFVSSAANAFTGSAMQKLFIPGDRIRHPKFGIGVVEEISGTGKDARIRIKFDTSGTKELALVMAPIVKVDEK